MLHSVSGLLIKHQTTSDHPPPTFIRETWMIKTLATVATRRMAHAEETFGPVCLSICSCYKLRPLVPFRCKLKPGLSVVGDPMIREMQTLVVTLQIITSELKRSPSASQSVRTHPICSCCEAGRAFNCSPHITPAYPHVEHERSGLRKGGWHDNGAEYSYTVPF